MSSCGRMNVSVCELPATLAGIEETVLPAYRAHQPWVFRRLINGSTLASVTLNNRFAVVLGSTRRPPETSPVGPRSPLTARNQPTRPAPRVAPDARTRGHQRGPQDDLAGLVHDGLAGSSCVRTRHRPSWSARPGSVKDRGALAGTTAVAVAWSPAVPCSFLQRRAWQRPARPPRRAQLPGLTSPCGSRPGAPQVWRTPQEALPAALVAVHRIPEARPRC